MTTQDIILIAVSTFSITVLFKHRWLNKEEPTCLAIVFFVILFIGGSILYIISVFLEYQKRDHLQILEIRIIAYMIMFSSSITPILLGNLVSKIKSRKQTLNKRNTQQSPSVQKEFSHSSNTLSPRR